MPDRDRPVRRPARDGAPWVVILLLLLLVAAGAAWWWYTQRQAGEPTAPVVLAPQPDGMPAAVPAPAPPSGPQHQVEVPADTKLPPLAQSDREVESALSGLAGPQGLRFFQLDGIVRRAVATVDSLGREQSAARLWPVAPTPDRFKVSGEGEIRTISPDNGQRYTPFVLFAESLDMKRAASTYARFYPLFQEAYEELGYPGKYFNDRLVEVIDHLLQTPEPEGPVQVRLLEVRGDVPSQRPWVRYEFVDPRLQSLSSGQRLMIRMGLVNERRLKAQLRELRREITSGAAARK